MRFQGAYANIPHPDRLHTGGHDAWSISPLALIVADGVGSWTISGVDPAIWTRALVNQLETLLRVDPRASLKDLVRRAFVNTAGVGSCTLTMVVLRPATHQLEIYNLGDSGLVVYRNGVSVFQTTPTRHGGVGGIVPHQLGREEDGTISDVYPEAGVVDIIDVEVDDLLVLGSDGLWDNLSPHLISLHLMPAFPPMINATMIGDLATETAESAQGKIDDITVVVGIIAD